MQARQQRRKTQHVFLLTFIQNILKRRDAQNSEEMGRERDAIIVYALLQNTQKTAYPIEVIFFKLSDLCKMLII